MTLRAKVIPLTAPPADAALGAWAEFYARLDWRVLPLAARSKIPAISKDEGGSGVHDATSNLEQIRSWWSEPLRNIGLACSGGLVVIDIDHRSGGAEVFDKLMAAHRMPAAPFVMTGDGLHVYLRDPAGRLGTVTKIGPGVEVRGDGYYVVAPPSIHPSGRIYQWAKGYGPVETRGLPEVPLSLLAVLAPEMKPAPPAATRPTPRPISNTGRTPTPYGQKALLGVLQEISQAAPGVPGDGRHDRVYRAAARCGDLIRGGHLDGATTFDALVDAGLAVAKGDYSEDEIVRWIRDAILQPSKGKRGAG